MSAIEIVDGKKVRIRFDAKRCIHSRHCVLSLPDGPLDVRSAANGPLHVSGAIEVVTGTGKTVNRTTEAAFCRCGHSANKPYCDGSHARVGFQAPGT